MIKKIVLFDFDGVFVSDFYFHKQHIESFLGKKISDQDFYELHSGNVFKNDGKGLELAEFDVMRYCNFIKEDITSTPLVEGMREVFAHACHLGRVYIVSSGCEFNITNFLAENTFTTQDITVYGVETHPSKKVKFEKIIEETGVAPENMIFITDTLGDMVEASDVGIASIGVTWGFQRIDTLEQGAPFGFAHKPREIICLMDAYFDIEKEL